MPLANTPAYRDSAKLTTVKSFVEQAPTGKVIQRTHLELEQKLIIEMILKKFEIKNIKFI
jgi:hypothetical protein